MWGDAFKLVTPEGCMTPEEYRLKYFVPLVAAACTEALNSLSPSGVASELGHAVLGHPRRCLLYTSRLSQYRLHSKEQEDQKYSMHNVWNIGCFR